MKKLHENLHITLFVLLLVLTLIGTSGAFAQDSMSGERLAQVNRCYACHHLSQTLIGPPYRAIAARHSGQKEVMVDVLARKIILGGGGSWGVVPMVPNEHVSEEDARNIARWILNLGGGG